MCSLDVQVRLLELLVEEAVDEELDGALDVVVVGAGVDVLCDVDVTRVVDVAVAVDVVVVVVVRPPLGASGIGPPPLAVSVVLVSVEDDEAAVGTVAPGVGDDPAEGVPAGPVPDPAGVEAGAGALAGLCVVGVEETGSAGSEVAGAWCTGAGLGGPATAGPLAAGAPPVAGDPGTVPVAPGAITGAGPAAGVTAATSGTPADPGCAELCETASRADWELTVTLRCVAPARLSSGQFTPAR